MVVAELWTEIRRAARTLARAPGFTALVVATLALGIGANTAVFTVLDAVLLAPLPYSRPDRLVRVYAKDLEDGGDNFLPGPVAVAYAGWNDVFEDFGVLYSYRETGADLTDGDRPERVITSNVDGGFFDALGVEPLLGRTFREEESMTSGEDASKRVGAPSAVLSYGLWQRLFGSDRGVLGRTIHLDGTAYQVVGVMPQGFTNPFGSPPDLWLPQDLVGRWNSWGNFYLSGVARLRDGVTPEQAQARVDVLADGLRAQEPDMGDWGVAVRSLRDDIVGDQRRTMLWILAAAVGLVLLSACVNAGNLVLARNLSRGRDLAVRGALGSGRRRLVLHLLAESALLAVIGGALGVLVGWTGVRALLSLAPDALPRLVTPTLSGRLLVVAGAATTAALALFGLAPALRLSRTAPAQRLRGGRGESEGATLKRIRAGLVVTQVAVALVLVVGAGLLTRSFARLRAVDLGVNGDGVLTFEVHLPQSRYPDGASRQAFHQALDRRLEGLPGVVSAGAASWLPVNGRYHSWGVLPLGRDFDPESSSVDEDNWFTSDVRVVEGDYFETLGIQVVRGQPLDELDPGGPKVVWVNERAAADIFGEENPIGEQLYAGNEPRRVVGVVENVANDPHGGSFRETYIPHAQFADDRNWALIHTVRTRGDLGDLQAEVRRELAQLDPVLVLYRPRPFRAFLATARAEDRFATTLMGTFALLALALSAIGTYGVLANAVLRRRREIGIRMALGADAGAVRGMVLRSASAMLVLGAVLGTAGAWVGSRWLQSLLFGVTPDDPLVWGGGVTLLLGFGVLAAWLPARRATRVDPARTLGAE